MLLLTQLVLDTLRAVLLFLENHYSLIHMIPTTLYYTYIYVHTHYSYLLLNSLHQMDTFV